MVIFGIYYDKQYIHSKYQKVRYKLQSNYIPYKTIKMWPKYLRICYIRQICYHLFVYESSQRLPPPSLLAYLSGPRSGPILAPIACKMATRSCRLSNTLLPGRGPKADRGLIWKHSEAGKSILLWGRLTGITYISNRHQSFFSTIFTPISIITFSW